MKKFIFIFAIVATFVACGNSTNNNGNSTDTTIVDTVDTIPLDSMITD